MNSIKGINKLIENLGGVNETNLIFDGFHTFGEIYEHRVTLYILLCGNLSKQGICV